MSIQSGNQGIVIIPERPRSSNHEASSRNEEIESCFLNQSRICNRHLHLVLNIVADVENNLVFSVDGVVSATPISVNTWTLNLDSLG
jgi:hypothetical protein